MEDPKTTTHGGELMVCDRCGREIPPDKSYLNVGGWKICGICQFESEHGKVPEYPPQPVTPCRPYRVYPPQNQYWVGDPLYYDGFIY